MPDKLLDSHAERIKQSLRLVEGNIIMLAGSLQAKNGRLTSSDASLAHALDLRNQIFTEFKPYLDEASAITKEFDEARTIAKARFDDIGVAIAFTRADSALIAAYSNDAFIELKALGMQRATAIGTIIYEGALTGVSKKDLQESVRQVLIGGTDKAGRPLEQYAVTIANTRYMEVDAIITKRKAADFGVTKFKYYGSTITDSREWCVKHAGKTFTEKEIKEWEDKKWTGKKAGDPFIARGGWNCRHHFVPVLIDKE